MATFAKTPIRQPALQKKSPVHAGFQLEFTDEITELIYEKINDLVSNMNEKQIASILKKSYCRGVYDTSTEKIARSMIEVKRKCVINAQIHINKTTEPSHVKTWYDSELKKSVPDDAKKAYIHRMYVGFDEGIVAFSTFIRGKPLYFTLTNYSNKTLQQIKKLVNNVEHSEAADYRFLTDIKFSVAIEPYIACQ